MERKIGETFEFEGKKLKVVETETSKCKGCFFFGNLDCSLIMDIRCFCSRGSRTDKKNVIFIEVKDEQEEQPQEETEEPKERKIGEVFEFEGKKLQVRESHRYSCDGCFFNGHCEHSSNPIIGICEKDQREDEKDVIFVEVQEQEEAEEQHQEEPQKLNLCEILRDCPRGTKLYSPIFGEVDFEKIRSDDENAIVITKGDVTASFTKEGFYYADLSEECLLFPSKEQRDWSKFTAPWLKKGRFDPKTLKAFDRVLVKDEYSEIWSCDLFSHIDNDESYKYFTISTCRNYCIPYNDDTKHLVGTTDEAPEYYRYWED